MKPEEQIYDNLYHSFLECWNDAHPKKVFPPVDYKIVMQHIRYAFAAGRDSLVNAIIRGMELDDRNNVQKKYIKSIIDG